MNKGSDPSGVIPVTSGVPTIIAKKDPSAPHVSAYTASAHDAVTFRMVESVERSALSAEITAGGKPFKGEFMHQHFGEDEEIKGYMGLQVDIWFSAQTYHAWIDIRFKAKRYGALKLHEIFAEKFPTGYSKNKDDFIKAVSTVQLPDIASYGDTMRELTLSTGSVVKLQRFILKDASDSVKVRGCLCLQREGFWYTKVACA